MGAAYLKGPKRVEPRCAGKRCYRNETQAAHAGFLRMQAPAEETNTLALWTYHCAECGWWHLTRREDPKQKPITGGLGK